MNSVAKMFTTITLAALLVSSIDGAAINHLDGTCVCTREFEPICGSDGVTYFNNCLFNCATGTNPKLQFDHNGACEEISKIAEGCKCSREYLPICGTDDRTYDNECQLDCQRRRTPELGVLFQGRCDETEVSEILPFNVGDCVCTRIFDPVCGSDGKTYSNDCRFTCQQNKYIDLTISHRGECKAAECICTLEYSPVCGSNGKTYSNECELNCEHRKDETLELESQGPCEFAVPY